RDRYGAAALQLRRQCSTSCQADAASNNSISTQYALGHICDMHGTTLSAADAGLSAVNLLEEGFRASILGNKVPVPAMSRGDPVTIGKVSADACSNGLLSDINMDGTGQLSGFEFL